VSLSDKFFVKLAELAKRHNTEPAVFLDVWNAESALDPTAENPSTHAQGLNQMLPGLLKGGGPPVEYPERLGPFKDLPGEDQLPWIEKLITLGERVNGGPFRTAARYYHSNFFPQTMPRGSSPETVVVANDATDPLERVGYLLKKAALDPTGKGKITYADVTAYVNRAKNSNRATYDAALARLGKGPVGSTARGGGSSSHSWGAAPVLIGVGVLAAAFFAWRSR
jgi:hypothetical protein